MDCLPCSLLAVWAVLLCGRPPRRLGSFLREARSDAAWRCSICSTESDGAAASPWFFLLVFFQSCLWKKKKNSIFWGWLDFSLINKSTKNSILKLWEETRFFFFFQQLVVLRISQLYFKFGVESKLVFFSNNTIKGSLWSCTVWHAPLPVAWDSRKDIQALELGRSGWAQKPLKHLTSTGTSLSPVKLEK